MVKEKEKPGGIRIGRLSEMTGVSRDTIKFYLKEGLIPRPVKTGSTMSYYDPSCVERIALIKKLQSERFLPLQVIKDMLRDEGSVVQELALAEAFMGMSAFSDPVTAVSAEEILKKTGYSSEEIEKVERAGMIGPRRNEPGREFTTIDLQILSLIRRREQAGFSLDYSLLMMGIYRDAISTIVREGTRLFAIRANIDEKLVTMVENVSEGERALAEFMPLIRTKLKEEYFGQLGIQFGILSDRIRDVFDFKSIRVTDADVGYPAAIDGLFLDGPADSSQRERLSHLAGGIRALLRREYQESRDVFRDHLSDGPWGTIVTPLLGLSYIIAASTSQWYLDVIRDLRTAAGYLLKTPEDTDSGVSRVMGEYLRGAGLAIIPDSFDTHRPAAELLDGLRPLIDEQAARVTGRERRAFLREVWVKSRLILATTYLYDRDVEKAHPLLTEIEQDPEVHHSYRDRARQQLARQE